MIIEKKPTRQPKHATTKAILPRTGESYRSPSHHFHPAVVQELVVSGVIQFKDYLDEAFVKKARLLETGQYTAADMFKEKIDGKKVYTPVPSYKRALDDYKHAATHFQLMDVIKGCRDSIYGHSFKKRNEDDVAMPVDKMPRRSMENKEDLQRTVCILAENMQLSKQLQEEMERNHNAGDGRSQSV